MAYQGNRDNNRQRPFRVLAAENTGKKSGKKAERKKFLGFGITDGEVDYPFLLAVILLLAYGLVMLFSAGSARAFSNFGDSLWYFKNQFFYAILGGIAMYATSKLDYHDWGKWAGIILLGSTFLLLLVIIPGVGTTRNGATRWLFGFQPSETAKFAIILFFSFSLSKNQKLLPDFLRGFCPYIAVLGVIVVLLALEPHFSCILLIGVTGVLLLFVAGAKIKHFFIVGIPAVFALAVYAVSDQYRIARFVSFMDPFADKQGDGWQVVQSLYAIGSGGIFGLGLGQSRQKYQSLPEPQNDFIYSVLAEELGLLGAIVLILLFVFLIYRGIKIAAKAPDLFGTLLVTGIVGIVGFQAIINMGVVTATLPATGMPLPFFSYGGSALTLTMAEMGLVLSVSRQTRTLL